MAPIPETGTWLWRVTPRDWAADETALGGQAYAAGTSQPASAALGYAASGASWAQPPSHTTQAASQSAGSAGGGLRGGASRPVTREIVPANPGKGPRIT
jgi:hypothetical protein